jgi:Holliday junction resolvase RusA-like endonuclease
MDLLTAKLLRNAGIDPDTIPDGTIVNGKPAKDTLETHRQERSHSLPVSLIGPGRRIDLPGLILLTIPGTPMGKPRMTQRDKWKGRDCVLRYHAWADQVRAIAGKMPEAEQVAALNWVAFFEPPKSWSKKRREAAYGTPHRAKPDRDNLDKMCLDILWKNDSAIYKGTIEKLWSKEARIEIHIYYEGTL